jgi:hypothetical protein
MYCVPTALSIITGQPYDSCVSQIQRFLGDIPIKGVYIPIAVKILRDNGFIVEQRGEGGWALNKFKATKGLFLVEINRHAIVIRDGKLYDNNHPQGTYNLPKSRVVRCYEVAKGQYDYLG